MSQRTISRSFAGGEITPELYARLDLPHFQTGVAKALNVEVLPHGALRNRAGFEYVLQTKYNDKKSTLIPFEYINLQSYALEFGHLYVRFHTMGAPLREAEQTIVGITAGYPATLTYANVPALADVANGDWFYLLTPGVSDLNERYVVAYDVNAGAHTFKLKDLRGAVIDTTGISFTSGTLARVYELVTSYTEDEIADIHYAQSGATLTLVHTNHPISELTLDVATSAFTASVPTWTPAIASPTNVTGTPYGGGSLVYAYTVTAVSAGDSKEESFATSTTTPFNNDLTVQGNYNTVHWTNVSGAIRYNIYKESNGLYGYIGQADDGAAGFKDDFITADMSQTPPEPYYPFSGAGNYPQAVGNFEGRRWFAGSINKPGNLYGTRSGTDSNMGYSMPSRSDDSIAVNLKSRKVENIRHIVPLNEMLLLTSGGEWRVISQNSDVITPTTIGYKPQSYVGASNAMPALANSAVLYAQDRGARIRELSYTYESNGYVSSDVSVMAAHLFDYAYTIKQLAFSRQPLACLWAVRSDGQLLGMTYVPEHKVYAWHQHETQGWFESCCTVSENVTGL
jgi:hypothetical protein